MPVTRVVITKDGKVIIEGEGYTGRDCLADLEKLLNALRSYGINVNVESQQLKQEAYVTETQENVLKVRA